MKKNLLKSILMAVALILGTTGAWAAVGDKVTVVDQTFTESTVLESTDAYTWGSELSGMLKSNGLYMTNQSSTGNNYENRDFLTFANVIGDGTHEVNVSYEVYCAKDKGQNPTYYTISYFNNEGDLVFAIQEYSGKWAFGCNVIYATAEGTETVALPASHIKKGGGSVVNLSIKFAGESAIVNIDGNTYSAYTKSAGIKAVKLSVTGENGYDRDMYVKNYKVETTEAEAVQVAGYTLNYVVGGTTVKTVEKSGTVGESITLTANETAVFYNEDNTQKYIYVSDDAAGKTIAQDGSTVVTITYREADKFAYTLKSSLGGIIKEGSDWEGETFNVAYPRYLAQDGTLYSAGKGTAGWYLKTIELTQNNVEATIDYTAGETGVVFLSEAENIETLTLSTAGNSDVRCSNGLCAYNAGEGDAVIATLPNGKYKLYTSVWGSKDTEFIFKAGENQILSITTTGSIQDGNSEEFELNAASTAITLGATDNAGRGIDFVYIIKTGDAELAAPTPATGKMDFIAMNHATSTTSSHDGDIPETGETFNADEFSVTVSASTTSTANRFWAANGGSQLRVYGGTITVKAAAGKILNKVVFDQSQWGGMTVNVGTLDAQTWTGEAEEVVFTVTSQCRINAITVGDNTAPAEPLVDAANIAAFKALEAGTKAKLAVNGAKVTFVNGDNTYIEDETGALLLYQTGLKLTANKAITGFINGAHSVYSESLDELTAIDETAASEITEADAAISATVMTVAEACDVANASKLVKLENVNINADYQTITQGEDEIAFYDKFGVMKDYTYPAVGKSIVGILNTSKNVNLFCPVSPDSIVAGEVVIPEVANIAAAKEADVRGTEIKLNVTGAKVTLYGGNNMTESFIEDETGALMVDINISKLLGEDGVTLTGYIIGKITKDQRRGGVFTFEGTDNTASSEITKEATEIVPTTTTIADLNAGQVADVTSKFIRLENVNVKYESAGWSADISLVDGDQELYVNDAMFVLPEDMSIVEKFNSISGIVIYGYNGLEFVPYGTFDAVEKQIEFTEVANIAALKDIANDTDVKLALNNTQIKVLEGGRWDKAVYIEDETAGIQINDNEGTIFTEFGQTFNGYIYLKYKDEYGVKNLETAGYTKNSEYTVEVKEVVAKEVAWTDATSANYNQKLIKVNNVELAVKTITEGEGEDAYSYPVLYLKSGDKEMNMSDMFNKAYNENGGSLEPGMYNITGIIMEGPVYDENYEVAGYADYFIPTGETAFEAVTVEPVADLRKWDFRAWSEETVANMAADAATIVPTENEDGTLTYPSVTPWRTYEKVGGPTEAEPDHGGNAYWYGTEINGSEELTANGVVIAETKGLLFNTMAAGALAVGINYPSTSLGTYAGPSYLWIGGKNNSFTIPTVKSGSKVYIGIESHKNTDARGVKLTINGVELGQAVPKTFEEFVFTVPGETTDGTASDIVVTNTNGCHIYYIYVDATGEIDGINDVKANVDFVNSAVYTINGVKVRNAGDSLEGLAKGIYIIGGKKVVVK